MILNADQKQMSKEKFAVMFELLIKESNRLKKLKETI